MLAIAHGSFIRLSSCLLHVDGNENCLLTKKHFKANAAIAEFDFSDSMFLKSAAALYNGNDRLKRSVENKNEAKPSLYSMNAGGTYWTLSAIARMKDLEQNKAWLLQKSCLDGFPRPACSTGDMFL